jgi:ribosomal protein S18 acetylase RimI-like enzyme
MKYNHLYCAKIDGEIVGVMCYITSAHCQLKPLQVFGMLPSLYTILGKALPRVLAWRLNWKKHDFKQPHIHFGPIAVARNSQGRGVGSAMLRFFCDKMDETRQVAYLETDKEINLALSERFGFEIMEEDELFGVTNWFMVRNPVQVL